VSGYIPLFPPEGDYGDPKWNPMWEAFRETGMPIGLHVGGRRPGTPTVNIYESAPRFMTGLVMSKLTMAESVSELIHGLVMQRYPELKFVSVESGVGWIPFILEALDYELAENAPKQLAAMQKKPSEYFASNIYATFWFENNRNKLPELIEAVGEDSILFETDFPHPTCLYPTPLETVAAKMATLAPETRNKILGENARKLYRL
jgi:predicted TIM-barrel fold metal-dependent hydrolase